MEQLRLVVDLLTGLAWPVVVLSIALIFRQEVRDILRSRKTKLKAGPFRLAFEQARVDAESATAVATSRGEVPDGKPDAQQAEAPEAAITSDPTAAVLRSYSKLETALAEKLAAAGDAADKMPRRGSAVQLAALAADSGIITTQAAEAVRGLSVLRNLAAHGAHTVDPDEAREFVVLADAVLFALRATPKAQKEGGSDSS